MSKKQETPKYLYPQNDFIFKRIFGAEGNEDITKHLISNIIGEEIKKLEIKNPYLLRETKDDKEEILDIKAILDDDIQCDIEIQVGNNHDIEKRLLNSWAKMYRQSIGKGKNYINMKRTIVIFITLFDVDNLKGIQEYKTKWQIQEEKLKFRLTDVFEVDIIELSKAKKDIMNGKFEAPQNIKDWVTFLVNPKKLEEESKMEEMSEEVRKAYEIWQNLNLTEEERERAEHRYLELESLEYAKQYEHNLGREEGREQGLKEGREEGREQGREEGREQGRKEEREKLAKAMLKENIPVETIAKVTKLTEDEIKQLK